MDSNLKAVPAPPKTLDERIAEMKKALENFIANANREVARQSGKIEMAEEIRDSQKEPPDAD
jgi:hypothetical protein